MDPISLFIMLIQAGGHLNGNSKSGVFTRECEHLPHFFQKWIITIFKMIDFFFPAVNVAQNVIIMDVGSNGSFWP